MKQWQLFVKFNLLCYSVLYRNQVSAVCLPDKGKHEHAKHTYEQGKHTYMHLKLICYFERMTFEALDSLLDKRNGRAFLAESNKLLENKGVEAIKNKDVYESIRMYRFEPHTFVESPRRPINVF